MFEIIETQGDWVTVLDTLLTRFWNQNSNQGEEHAFNHYLTIYLCGNIQEEIFYYSISKRCY